MEKSNIQGIAIDSIHIAPVCVLTYLTHSAHANAPWIAYTADAYAGEVHFTCVSKMYFRLCTLLTSLAYGPLLLQCLWICLKHDGLQTPENLKTECGEESFNPDGLAQRSIKLLKDTFPDIEVIHGWPFASYFTHQQLVHTAYDANFWYACQCTTWWLMAQVACDLLRHTVAASMSTP